MYACSVMLPSYSRITSSCFPVAVETAISRYTPVYRSHYLNGYRLQATLLKLSHLICLFLTKRSLCGPS